MSFALGVPDHTSRCINERGCGQLGSYAVACGSAPSLLRTDLLSLFAAFLFLVHSSSWNAVKQAAAATQFPMARSLVLHNIFRDVADRHVAAIVIECRNLRSFVCLFVSSSL